jgi:hypothetical protein
VSGELREKVAAEVEYELGRAIKDWSPTECADRILALLSAPEPAEAGARPTLDWEPVCTECATEAGVPIQCCTPGCENPAIWWDQSFAARSPAPAAAEPEREALREALEHIAAFPRDGEHWQGGCFQIREIARRALATPEARAPAWDTDKYPGVEEVRAPREESEER